jgi:hypothetical protein
MYIHIYLCIICIRWTGHPLYKCMYVYYLCIICICSTGHPLYVYVHVYICVCVICNIYIYIYICSTGHPVYEVCMYVCMSNVCIHACNILCTFHAELPSCIQTYVCIICACKGVYVCMHTHMHTYVHTHMHTYVNTQTCIHTFYISCLDYTISLVKCPPHEKIHMITVPIVHAYVYMHVYIQSLNALLMRRSI